MKKDIGRYFTSILSKYLIHGLQNKKIKKSIILYLNECASILLPFNIL